MCIRDSHRSEACQCYTNEIWEADIERMFVNTFNTLKEHADEILDPVIRGMKKMQETNGLHEALGTDVYKRQGICCRTLPQDFSYCNLRG